MENRKQLRGCFEGPQSSQTSQPVPVLQRRRVFGRPVGTKASRQMWIGEESLLKRCCALSNGKELGVEAGGMGCVSVKDVIYAGAGKGPRVEVVEG